MNVKIAVVILNWNNAQDTIVCLQSLSNLNDDDYTIIVVDNGSSDDSVKQIQNAYANITLITLAENLGYAGGNNVGIRYALDHGFDHVCIVNNDVVVSEDALDQLVTAVENYRDYGVATPLIAEHEISASIWALGSTVNSRSGYVGRNHAGEPVAAWRNKVPFEVDAASGAIMLVKREVFEQAGLLDEDFFLYYEEIDWSLLARQKGFHILAVPPAIVWHKVSATLGSSSPVIDYYMLRNHLRLIGRHWKGLRKLFLMGKIAIRNLVTIGVYTMDTRQGSRIPSRNARLLALRDALLGRWGKMGPDVAAVCHQNGKQTN